MYKLLIAVTCAWLFSFGFYQVLILLVKSQGNWMQNSEVWPLRGNEFIFKVDLKSFHSRIYTTVHV
jgi:hypothetical protein